MWVSLIIDKFYLLKCEIYKTIFDAIFRPINFLYYPPLSNLNAPSLSFVYGELDKQALINNYGYESNKIKVVGSILFENYVEILNTDYNKLKGKIFSKESSLNNGKKTVVFLTGIAAEFGSNEVTAPIFIDFVKNIINTIIRNNFNLIIKLHPSANYDLYSQFNDLPGVLITKNINLLEVIAISDVVISEPSTAIFSSVLLRKKIIVLRFFKLHMNNFDFVKEGVAMDCQSFEQLESYLTNHDNLISSNFTPNYKNFLKKYCYFNEKKPTEIIANYIS